MTVLTSRLKPWPGYVLEDDPYETAIRYPGEDVRFVPKALWSDLFLEPAPGSMREGDLYS